MRNTFKEPHFSYFYPTFYPKTDPFIIVFQGISHNQCNYAFSTMDNLTLCAIKPLFICKRLSARLYFT